MPSEDYWRKHPTFDNYVAMILDTLANSYQDLIPTLKARFGYLPGEIESNSSY